MVKQKSNENDYFNLNRINFTDNSEVKNKIIIERENMNNMTTTKEDTI